MDDPVTHAVTICAPSTLGAAVRLAASFVAHHAGECTIHVCDGPYDQLDLQLDRVRVAGPPPHAPAEAATLVPWAVSAAFDAGRSPVVACSPTTVVTRALTPLVAATRQAGLAVVPRLLATDVADRPVDAAAVLRAGWVESGLIAWTETALARRVLRWWKYAVTGEGADRATDLFPALGAAVVRDAGLGVSRWNLHERPLVDSPYGPFAGDAMLRSCDLAGLCADHPPRWEDDGCPAPALDGYAGRLAWEHVVAMGERP